MLRSVPWFFGVFAIAIVLHTIWGVLLIAGDDALGATPLHTLGEIITLRYALAALLFGTSVLAASSLILNVKGKLGIALATPQQVLLLTSGGGALRSVLESSYADGVIRPVGFIGADQLGIILLATMHTMALIWLIAAQRGKYDNR